VGARTPAVGYASVGVRVGIDIGGTFTDLYALHGGEHRTAKVPSTPDDLAQAVVDVLEAGGIDLGRVDAIVHGSTVGINALLERSYPPVALVTTEGFRDLLEIGRYHRPRLYDPYQRKPAPLVPRRLRLVVGERTASNGSEVRPLDEAAAEQVARRVGELGVPAVAVAFVNAYADGAHERRMRELLHHFAPGAHVAVSSEVLPKVRALPRLTLTVLNAALQPVVSGYLDRLSDLLEQRGFDGSLWIVRSNGGVMSAQTAARRPEYTLMSGPAAGVAGAARLAGDLGFERVITLDMGGTSCDVSTVEERGPQITTEAELEWDVPVAAPMLDIRSIGSGGGSVAWVDRGRGLQVGPRSAGARPGPACYGRGGTEATVTDANLVLGLLGAGRRLGGRIPLDAERASSAVAQVAQPLGLATDACAAGIRQIVNEKMAHAVHGLLATQARDPRDYVLVAYGGAAGLHACDVAALLGIPRVLFPAHSGVLSARGCTMMDVRHDLETTFYAELSELAPSRLNAALGVLERDGLEELDRQGVGRDRVSIRRFAEMRYVGQSYELEVPLPEGPLDRAGLDELRRAFDAAHRDVHGIASDDPAALVNVRVSLEGALFAGDGDGASAAAPAARDGEPAPPPRAVHASLAGNGEAVPVHDSGDLAAGTTLQGPCIVEHPESTTWLPPGTEAEVAGSGTLSVEVTP
jgi:N-methylhydantoinase A